MKEEMIDDAIFEPSALLAELKDAAKGTPPADRPARLPLSRIRQVPQVFQPRGMSERHVSELARIITANGEVEPVTVVQVGADAVLIDGHHRVAAYGEVDRHSIVPVRYFEGALGEAVLEAGRANSRAKLPMTTQERQDFAWKLVLMNGYSKADIATASGASKSQVANMRTVMRRLGAGAFNQRSWWSAREAAQGRSTTAQMNDDEIDMWKEERANHYADRLSKEFGTKLSNNTEVAARALSIHFGRRFEDLVGELRGLAQADEGEDFESDF
jgi:hypothetical protein